MKWPDHRRWAKKRGISTDVATYVDKIIDTSQKSQLPAEFKQDVSISAESIAANRGAKQGNSALSLVIGEELMKHDAGRQKPTRGDLAAECMLQHLQQKGENFVIAWYLHHHLDYLHEQRTTEDNLKTVLKEYKKKHPEAYSPNIEQFLLEHENKLASELGYCDE